MDVRLSTEQRALRDAAAQMVDKLAPSTVGELDDAERAAKLDAAVAAAGWRELRVENDEGAPWASGVEVAILAEELARGNADVAFVGPTLAAELRRLAGAPPATESETIAVSADLAWLTPATIAVDASGAANALVLVETDDGHGLASVPSPLAEARCDLTRPTATIDTGAATQLEPAALTEDDLTAWTALGLAITAAELVGTMRGAIDLTVDYARERQQYGKAIGSFQAVQHLLADALVAMEGARSAGLHAAWAVDALAPDDALAAAAVAKAYATRAARSVCETAIQVHGGIGNTWECLAHVHLRRAILSGDLLGGTGANLERVLAHAGVGDGRGGAQEGAA